MGQKTVDDQPASNSNALKQKLQALLLDDSKRTKTARLWDVYAEVESALNAGVKQKAVVDVLAEHGLEYTVASFRTVLQRLRGRARKGDKPSVKATGSPTTEALAQSGNAKPEVVAPLPVTKEAEATQNKISHNPRDLDAIARSTPDLDKLAAAGRKKR